MSHSHRKDTEFLKNVRFSDSVEAWVLQAKGFYYSADSALKGNDVVRNKIIKRDFISSEEGFLNNFCLKTVCYLLSHSIEASLKAIYLLKGGDQSTEEFSHDVIKLRDILISKYSLEKSYFDRDTIELAETILYWYGRYHRPKKNKIDQSIKKIYQESEDPKMYTSKFSPKETYSKLKILSENLLKSLPEVNSTSHLVFEPFC